MGGRHAQDRQVQYAADRAFAGHDRRPRPLDAAFQPFPSPDTGRVETDVAELLTAFVALLEHTPFPRMLAAFIDAAERDPPLRTLHAELTRRRREPLLVALTRAPDRGIPQGCRRSRPRASVVGLSTEAMPGRH